MITANRSTPTVPQFNLQLSPRPVATNAKPDEGEISSREQLRHEIKTTFKSIPYYFFLLFIHYLLIYICIIYFLIIHISFYYYLYNFLYLSIILRKPQILSRIVCFIKQ